MTFGLILFIFFPSPPRGKDREYGVSRGVDFQNIANVLNFDFPTSVESYIHRVGRWTSAFQIRSCPLMRLIRVAHILFASRHFAGPHGPTTKAQLSHLSPILSSYCWRRLSALLQEVKLLTKQET